MQQERYDVLIVGAGIVGCAIAYHLANARIKVALFDRGSVAGEASQAAAGMLAPLDDDISDAQNEHPSVSQFYITALQYYTNLDQMLKDKTEIDIGLLSVPTLRPAFDESDVERLHIIQRQQQHLLPGLQWLDHHRAHEAEPLLPSNILGALISPQEHNVQAQRLTQAYARAATLLGAHIFEGCSVEGLRLQGQRAVGIETVQGTFNADHIVLAAGAWTARWQKTQTNQPSIFPIKGQALALSPSQGILLHHTIYHHKIGCIVPKADGHIYVAATSEHVGFDKAVTAAGLHDLLSIVAQLSPQLKKARFERAWAGLRPGSADDLPLLGAKQSTPGLWIASGHSRDGILTGPLTGHIIAELIQGHPVPFVLDLAAFDPDRFDK